MGRWLRSETAIFRNSVPGLAPPMPSPVHLAHYDNSWYDPGGSPVRRIVWFVVGLPILRSAWIPSSSLRVALLRFFGAQIGQGVVIKPSVAVKYPWHLVIGDHCWIGEQAWIDNLTSVHLESNVCLSQGAYLCTGNHDWTDPRFGLIIAPIRLSEGSWVGAKAILTPGTVLGIGAIASAGSVITGAIPDYQIFAGNPAVFVRKRVMRSAPATSTARTSGSVKEELSR
jgi:putative colanic acid biosynthesis acetyltransferase WcaF